MSLITPNLRFRDRKIGINMEEHWEKSRFLFLYVQNIAHSKEGLYIQVYFQQSLRQFSGR